MSVEEREAPVQSDRRRPVAGVRTSWASSDPFVRSGADGPDARPVAPLDGPLPRSSWERSLLRIVVAADLLGAAAVGGITAASLRLDPVTCLLLALVSAAAWSLVLLLHGAYRVRHLGSGPEEFQAVMRVAVTLIAVLGLTAYATQTLLPRRWVLVAIPVLALVTSLVRYGVRTVLQRERARGRAMLRTLVVGSHTQATPVAADLARQPSYGYHVVGICPPALGRSPQAGGLPVLGTVSDIAQVVHDHRIDVVIVTGSSLSGPALRRLSWALEHAGADLVVAPGLVEVGGPHVSLRPTAGLSLVHVERPSRHLGRGLGKAVLDRTLGAALLTAAALPLAVCALAVVLTSPGPAFFRQTRAGLDGRPFTMWKLRSMVVDAEARREHLLGDSDRDGLMFKMHADPRITRVGRVLRRFSLDELPQLWNVVAGDMSLVGPRPPLMSEFEQYHDAVNRRLRVKPGLTGLWQVSGRADLSWEASVNLDLRYVDNWSLAMDLLILWRTFRVVVRGSGAY
ncbi:exopolysaccharide biosynthesis polyprenyl glycosylphosphotransferase [Aquipuribacter hungaricus]|uniref:Sugar transferase n=1 Tax=Aquipuribacter hungaricus TaxID=545624 RepID=A0ABV7WBV2_9MICO